MKDYGQIRQMYIRDGKSIRQIAREMHISRNTVAKYCKGNALPGIRCEYHRTSAVITEEVTRFIQSCLDEDAKEPNKKQHHTAKRIYDRLVEFQVMRCRLIGVKLWFTSKECVLKSISFVPAFATAVLLSWSVSAGRIRKLYLKH